MAVKGASRPPKRKQKYLPMHMPVQTGRVGRGGVKQGEAAGVALGNVRDGDAGRNENQARRTPKRHHVQMMAG